MTDLNSNSSPQLLTGLINEWIEFAILSPNRISAEQATKKTTKSLVGDSLPLTTLFEYRESHEKKERKRICSLLKNAIETGFVDCVDSVYFAELIESCLFVNYFYSLEAIYYSKARILCENLTRNAKHLLSHYDPEILCFFPSDALASGTVLEEWRNHYKHILEQKLLVQQGKRRGLFECQFCHSKNTDSHESHTRSADEPATIFVNCLDCGRHFRR